MNKTKLYYCAETDQVFLLTDFGNKLITITYDDMYINLPQEKKEILRNTILLDKDFYGEDAYCEFCSDANKYMSGRDLCGL